MITMKTDGVGEATFFSFRVVTWGYNPNDGFEAFCINT